MRDKGHFADDGYEMSGNGSVKSTPVDAIMAVTGLPTLLCQVDNVTVTAKWLP